MSNSTTLIERIEFQAVAPVRAMPGLDAAQRKLEALGVALTAINARLSSVTSMSAFRRTTKTIEDSIKQLETRRGKGLTLKQVATNLGLPSDDLRQYILRVQEQITQDIAAHERKRKKLKGPYAGMRHALLKEQRDMEASLKSVRDTFVGPTMRVRSAPAASRMISAYQKQALNEVRDFSHAQAATLQTLLGGGTVGAVPNIATVAAAIEQQAEAAKKGKGKGGGGKKNPGTVSGAPSGAQLIATRVIETDGKPDRQVKTYQKGGKLYEVTEEEGAIQRRVTTEKIRKQAEQDLKRQLGAMKKEASGQLAGARSRGEISGIRKTFTAQANALMAGAPGQRFIEAQLQPMVDAFVGDTLPQLIHKQVGRGGKATATLRKAADVEARKQQREAAKASRQFARETRMLQAAVAADDTLPASAHALLGGPSIEQMQKAETAKATAKATAAAEKKRRANEAAERRQRPRSLMRLQHGASIEDMMASDAEKALVRQLSPMAKYGLQTQLRQAAQWKENALKSGGLNDEKRARIEAEHKQRVGRAFGGAAAMTSPGVTQELLLRKHAEAGAASEKASMKATRASARMAAASAASRKELDLLTGDFIRNTVKVTGWASSVAVLYGTLGLLRHGFMRTVEIGAQLARLDQVFSGVGGSARALTGDVLHLAAVNGRSTDEAMAAAVQWSRMGLTRTQVNEAVNVSLRAANVAEMSAADATEHLQAIMRNFDVQVGGLASKLGELNQVSNTYNVTNKDMLEGISRSAAMAKQAGLPFEELLGLIGATVGATKQSGGQVGNALKTAMVSLSNPELQEKMRTQYRFEATDGGENIKGMSQMIGDLYVQYQKMVNIEKQSMLFSLAGKFQANRMAAILDNYVTAQVKSVQAQLHLNSAHEENQKITATLKAQFIGLTSEWEKFVSVQANHGPVQTLNAITKSMRGMLTLLNTPVGGAASTGLLALFTAAGARTALTALNSGGPGFVGRSGKMAGNLARGFNQWLNLSVARVAAPPGAMGPMQPGGFGGAMYKLNMWGEDKGRAGMGALRATMDPTAHYGPKTAALAAKLGPVSSALRGVTAAQAAWNLALAATSKALAATAVMLYEFAIPLLVIAGAVWGFNAALEGLGMTSERATGKLARFNTEAERAHAAAGAMQQAVRLMQTAQQAFDGRRMPADQSARMIEGVSEVAFLGEGDDAQRKKGGALKDQLKTMLEQNDQAAIQEVLTQRISSLHAARRQQMAMELDAQSRAIAELQGRIEVVKGKQEGGHPAFHSKRQKHLTELEEQLEQVRGKRLALIQDTEEDINAEWEKRLSYNEKHLSGLEQEKSILESIGGLYEQIRTATPLDKAVVTSARLAAQVLRETSAINRLQVKLDNDKPGQPERDKKVAELQDRAAIIREGITKQETLPGYYSNNGMLGDTFGLAGRGWSQYWGQDKVEDNLRQRDAKFDSLRQVQEDIKKARAGTLDGMSGQDDYRSTKEQQNQAITRRRDLRVQQAGQEATLPLAERATRFQLGQQRAGIEQEGKAYGYDESDKNLRQQQGLQERINELMSKRNRTEEEYGELTDAIARKRELEVGQLGRYQNILKDINQLAIDNNREMMRSFFGAGPAEMLRKLAAFRAATKGGMTQGAFFGMSPGMREDYGKFDPGWSAQGIELANEKARSEKGLKDSGKMNPDGSLNWTAINEGFLKVSDLLKDAVTGLDQKLLEALPTEALQTAGTLLSTAAEKLDRAADRLLGVGGPGPVDHLFPTPPPRGQFGGVGGGIGF